MVEALDLEIDWISGSWLGLGLSSVNTLCCKATVLVKVLFDLHKLDNANLCTPPPALLLLYDDVAKCEQG